MTLNSQEKKLLNAVFSAFLKSPDGISAARFRVDNEQFISDLDQLERFGYLQRKEEHYFITFLSLPYLIEGNPDIQSLVEKCELIFALLKGDYKDNLGKDVTSLDIIKRTGLTKEDVRVALYFINMAPFLRSTNYTPTREVTIIAPSENILKYESFKDILREQEERNKSRLSQSRESKKFTRERPISQAEQEILSSAISHKANWKAIKMEFDITKNHFGKKINFVSDRFRRSIIFRDTEQSYVLANSGFSKPAVILAGSVIEELLRLYLIHKQVKPVKDDFDGYIQTCEQKGLLKKGISRLSDSARHFRNLVHLKKEKDKRYTISKVAAKGAVASIFTIANDF